MEVNGNCQADKAAPPIQVFSHLVCLSHTQIRFAQGQHIFEAMLCFQELDASRALDKFNGYRGLHSITPSLPLADYSRPDFEVFEEITVWLLKERQIVSPLALDLKGKMSRSLASWVPDWSAKPPIEPSYWRCRHHFYEAYTCNSGLEWRLEYECPGRLRLHGVLVDEISTVALSAFESLDVVDHIDILRSWFVFATGRLSPPGCEVFFDDDAFCDTMLAGCVRDPTLQSQVRKANAADYARWRQEVATMERSAAAGVFHGLLMESHATAVYGRVLFRTKRGSLGIGPPSIEPGDSVWVWGCGKAAFVTRQKPTSQERERRDTLLGHCYHYQLMTGRCTVDKARDQSSTCVLV